MAGISKFSIVEDLHVFVGRLGFEDRAKADVSVGVISVKVERCIHL